MKAGYKKWKMWLIRSGLLVIFLCDDRPALGQISYEDGIYNAVTGEPLKVSAWMAMLPDQFDLFEDDQPYEVNLETDFKLFNKEKFQDKYKQEALLSFNIGDSLTVKRVIRIEPRGEFRRKECNPPPIKLNFKKTNIYVKSIQELDKMKMVSGCKRTKRSEDYVLREYLVYKMYNLFTDLSFKAKLLKVNYVDTGVKTPKTTSSYAFVLEEVDDIENRYDFIELEVETAVMKNIIDEEMVRVALFQYMIGNTDWSITGLHNFKLFRDNDALQTKAHIVPYDFDYCGVVNAYYAIPYEEFEIENVRERLYRCECYPRELIEQQLDEFISRKEEVFRTIDDFPYLSKASRSDVAGYIKSFYDQIERPGAVEYFVNNCGKKL